MPWPAILAKMYTLALADAICKLHSLCWITVIHLSERHAEKFRLAAHSLHLSERARDRRNEYDWRGNRYVCLTTWHYAACSADVIVCQNCFFDICRLRLLMRSVHARKNNAAVGGSGSTLPKLVGRSTRATNFISLRC